MSELDQDVNVGAVGCGHCRSGGPKDTDQELRRRAVRVSHHYFRNRRGVDVAYSIYRPRSGQYQQVLVVASELGSSRAAYDRFATYMGFDHVVVTFDPAGVGDSRIAGRQTAITIDDWAGDLHYLVTLITDQFGRDAVGVAHGLGGVLFGLRRSRHVSKLVLVAAADPDFRLWPRLYQPVVVARWAHACANALCLGWLTWRGARAAPPLPLDVARQCARWCFKGSVLRPEGNTVDNASGCHKAPALVVFADDDRAVAPRDACVSLAGKLASAESELLALFHWDWAREGIRHSGYFSDVTGPRLWSRLNQWICS